MRKVYRIICCVLTLIMAFACMAPSVLAADNAETDTEMKKIPLLVIIASFDANGNGINDYDPNNPKKLFEDKTKDYYGEQWAGTTPEDQWDRYFGDKGYTVANYYKELTMGKMTFVPAEFTKKVPNQTKQNGVLAVTLKKPHPTASNNAIPTILDIIRATDEYIDYAAYDVNKDGKCTQDELAILILNSGPDHANTAEYYNSGTPRFYFAVHGTSQGVSLRLDGVSIESGNGGGRVSNLGEYSKVGTIMPIGIPTHELAHNFGAEDLYHRGGYTDATWPQPYRFSLQCDGNYSGGGATPAYLDPYQRVFLDWAEEEVVTDGEYTLYSTLTGKYKVLRVNTPDPDEYYLIEIRLKEGFEKNLTTGGEGGIMVWHIDEGINRRYFSIGQACSGKKDNGVQHDPGIVPLFRQGYDKYGRTMTVNHPSDPYYYLSDDPDTAVCNTVNFISVTTGSPSLNSYPDNWSGPKNFNIKIEALSKPGQEMKVRITTELSAKVAPVTQTRAESQTTDSITLKTTILSLNGEKLTKYGVIYSKNQNPTLENGKYVEGVLDADGKAFTTALTGLEQGTKYYYKVIAANENLEGESAVLSSFTSSPAVEKTYFVLKLHKYLTNKDKVNDLKVNFGEKIGDKLATTYMEKKGYTFCGWYLDAELTKAYDPEYTQDTYGELELFAKWEEGTSSTTSTAKVTMPAESTATTSTTETAGVESTTSTSAQSTETSVTDKPSGEGKGCKSTVGIGASFAMIVAIGAGLALGKKKTK